MKNGRSIGQTLPLGASGYYEEEKDSSLPYNNDRLDDAVSVDYSQALGGTPRIASGTSGGYASKIVHSSVRSKNEHPFVSSGQYEMRINTNLLHQTTSTPEPKFQRKNSGTYAERIGNSMADDREHGQIGKQWFPIGIGKTVHHNYQNQSYREKQDAYHPPIPEDIRLEGLESPRSTQWPETARSYPVGFEASDIADDAPYIPPTGESTDQASLGRQTKKYKSKRKESKRDKQEDLIHPETPPWADRLLTKESFLLGKFRNMRSAINRWTIRRKTRLRPLSKTRGQSGFDIFYNPEQERIDSTSNLVEKNKKRYKTNNVATFLCGLSLIVIFVFPVIPILVIYTDRSDIAQIQISMKFNGTVDTCFNASGMTYSICYQIDSAFSSTSTFQSCGVTSFRNGSIEADISLLFTSSNIPNNKNVVDTINTHFTNLPVFHKYVYKQNSIRVKQYTFIKSRLIEPQPYTRGLTTTTNSELNLTPIPNGITTPKIETQTTIEKFVTSEFDPTTTIHTSLAHATSTTRETTETKEQTKEASTLSTSIFTINESSSAATEMSTTPVERMSVAKTNEQSSTFESTKTTNGHISTISTVVTTTPATTTSTPSSSSSSSSTTRTTT